MQNLNKCISIICIVRNTRTTVCMICSICVSLQLRSYILSNNMNFVQLVTGTEKAEMCDDGQNTSEYTDYIAIVEVYIYCETETE
jgi:hypothetical protein